MGSSVGRRASIWGVMEDVPHLPRCGAALEGKSTNVFVSAKVTLRTGYCGIMRGVGGVGPSRSLRSAIENDRRNTDLFNY